MRRQDKPLEVEDPSKHGDAVVADHWVTSSMTKAFETYLSVADGRYSMQCRRFSIFKPLLTCLAPSFEASISSRDAAAPSTCLARSGLSKLRQRKMTSCEADLLGSLAFAQRADVDFDFARDIELMLLAVRDAKGRQPKRSRDETGGDRFLTPRGRRASRRAQHLWGSAGYCAMCERPAEAYDADRQQAQRCEPGAKLSGTYCWHHKPFTGPTSGNRCNNAYRRGLERLNDYQGELSLLYQLFEGRHPADDDYAAHMWDEVLRALSWCNLTLDQKESAVRRLANLATNVGAANRLDDRRKTVLMMHRSGESIEAIGRTTALPSRKVSSEIAHMMEWLPEEIGDFLDKQFARESRLVGLWCSK